MKNNKATFNQILRQTSGAHSEVLMAKARLANRIAKRLGGKHRRAAYSAKSLALVSLIRNLPEKTRISKDYMLPAYVVVGTLEERSGLHLPLSALSA